MWWRGSEWWWVEGKTVGTGEIDEQRVGGRRVLAGWGTGEIDEQRVEVGECGLGSS